MRFREVIELLKDTGNAPVVLEGRRPKQQVLCAPSLVGRTMTTTYDASNGDALGWIGVAAIQKGPVDPVFNNFGGEDRFWFGPEGSQFGLHFGSKEQTMANYRVQSGMSSQPYEVVTVSPSRDFVVMKTRMHLENARKTQFDVEVQRTVRVLDSCPYTMGYSNKLQWVGFQTESIVTNLSQRGIEKETGVLSAWTPGLHPNSSNCVVVLPFRSGSNTELGEPIRRDYFKDLCLDGNLPQERWKTFTDHALMKADGKFRVKVGIGIRRARNLLGGLNLDAGELTLNDCELYPEMDYVSPYWRQLSQKELFDGEALSAYIDGPDQNGQRAGDFYELETLSPALTLLPGESFLHRNRVYHVKGDFGEIDRICRTFLKTSIHEAHDFLVEKSN